MLFRAILLSRISISLVHRIEIIKIEKKNRKTIISFLRILSTKKNKKICGKHAAASFTAAPDFLFCRYCELKNKQTNCAFQPRCKTIILLIIFCYDFFFISFFTNQFTLFFKILYTNGSSTSLYHKEFLETFKNFQIGNQFA